MDFFILPVTGTFVTKSSLFLPSNRAEIITMIMQLILMITAGMEARIGILTLLVNKRKALVKTIAPTTKMRDSLLDSLKISCEMIARQKPKNRNVISEAMNCRSAGTA